MKQLGKLPRLPQLLDRKLYKTGQTRGADDDVIFQNRVSRNSTVLIPYSSFATSLNPPPGETQFENGFIVCISPREYFGDPNIDQRLGDEGLIVGQNALVFYETREDWNQYPRKRGWRPATSRTGPLKGRYVARVPATTATSGSGKIVRGFTTTSSKGAGIRVFEYASEATIRKCRNQLEALFWHCIDAIEVASANGMSREDAIKRKEAIAKSCSEQGLLDYTRLIASRVLNSEQETTCPLCLFRLSAKGFFNRMQQAAGREVPDLTVTELNLFHIEELRIGIFNHRPYNLGWGHHHCNVVTKDSGISETLKWMNEVLQKNIETGHFTPANSGV
jgi:hypothetical protein